MNCKKPTFSTDNKSSVTSVVSALHCYFRDLQSYYKIVKGQLISELEYGSMPEKTEELKQKLSDVNRKLKYIHVLNNSASTVDEVMHLEEMSSEFRPSKPIVNVR